MCVCDVPVISISLSANHVLEVLRVTSTTDTPSPIVRIMFKYLKIGSTLCTFSGMLTPNLPALASRRARFGLSPVHDATDRNDGLYFWQPAPVALGFRVLKTCFIFVVQASPCAVSSTAVTQE